MLKRYGATSPWKDGQRTADDDNGEGHTIGSTYQHPVCRLTACILTKRRMIPRFPQRRSKTASLSIRRSPRTSRDAPALYLVFPGGDSSLMWSGIISVRNTNFKCKGRENIQSLRRCIITPQPDPYTAMLMRTRLPSSWISPPAFQTAYDRISV